MKNDKNASKTPKAPKIKRARSGAVPVIITVLILIGIVLLNIIITGISNRHSLSIDITENAQYQLQTVTENYLSQVNRDVSIYVLETETDFESGDSNNYKYYVQANKLLHAMANCSDKIELHYIDLVAQPSFTSLYPKVDWTKSHAVLVVSGDLYTAVDLTDMFSFDQEQYSYYGSIIITEQNVEQAITSAVMNVTTTEKSKVTVLTGQGEQDMTPFTTLLERNAYEIKTVSLLTGSIDEDSEFVIIYVPSVDITDDIYQTLTKWLKNDGKYGHHLIYVPNDQVKLDEFPNLNALLSDYGMEMQYGHIYENSENYVIPGANQFISLFDYADDTAFTDDLHNPSIPVVMMLTMPVKITDETMAKPLLLSSEKSFLYPLGKTDKELEDFEPEFQVLNGAAIGTQNDGTEEGKDSSVVVIGSYEVFTTGFLTSTSYNNAEYFVNLFNVLSENDHIEVIIEGKDPSDQTWQITQGTNTAVNIISPIVRFIIPLGILIAGLIIWIRRRHR